MRQALLTLALLFGAPLASETLVKQSEIAFTHKATEFGGLSGLEITDQGAGLIAVSDKGTIWRGAIARDAEGKAAAIMGLEFRPILTSKNAPVDRQNIDAEGLDRDSQGNLYISFESNSRVSRFRDWESAAELIQRPPEFLDFGFNSGPEAMTIGPDDEIWVSPERSGDLERPFPIYVYDGQGWSTPYHIRRAPPFLLVGMDYDPVTNRLYVLERDFNNVFFRSRIRRFFVGEAGLEDEALLLETRAGEYGNLEGISHWRDASGQAYLSLIADDNFSLFASTRLVEFRIQEAKTD